MDGPGTLWHVTLTVSGPAVTPDEARAALERLAFERPFFVELRYADDCAQLRYWEEAGSLLEAAHLAVKLWGQHRQSAHLPPWHVVGLDVIDRDTYLQRGGTMPVPALVGAGQVHPF